MLHGHCQTSVRASHSLCYIDYIEKILGLEVSADTLVGDEMIKGISGGQKKYIMTGEMLVGPARALFMDEISIGLDSSTTYQILNSLRQFIHILNGTAVISLLQPTPETYELFMTTSFCCQMGKLFAKVPTKMCLSSLNIWDSSALKGKELQTSYKKKIKSSIGQTKMSLTCDIKEFAEAFQSFHIGRKLGDELANPFDESKSHPVALMTKTYGANKEELLKACFWREYLLMKRNSFVYVFKMVQLFMAACVTMTLFLRTEMHGNTVKDGGIYLGALFFTMIMIMFNGFSELSMSIMKLLIFYKQRDLLFYLAWAYSRPMWILKIPIIFLEVGVSVFMTYYVIVYDPNIKRFFKQYVLLLCVNQMASALFRFIGALAKNMIVANTVGPFALLTVWFCGDLSCLEVSPNSTESLGVPLLKSRGLFPQVYWYWIGVGAIIGYVFLFALALKYLNPFGKPQSVLSEEAMTEKIASKTGESMELSSSDRSFERGNDSHRNTTSSRTLFARVGRFSESG